MIIRKTISYAQNEGATGPSCKCDLKIATKGKKMTFSSKSALLSVFTAVSCTGVSRLRLLPRINVHILEEECDLKFLLQLLI